LNQSETQPNASATEHFDVIIIGAGISGIDAAYHLKKQCPTKRFAVLENQQSYGGTWLTHKYPGIRSDSDLFTFGYKWKPWTSAPIASAEEILSYLDSALDEEALRQYIRFGQTVVKASWNSDNKCWQITSKVGADGQQSHFSCNFLWMCQGYYQHKKGYTPDWPNMDQFEGDIIHPQTWPEGYNYTDKDILVIGSGATAATLVPAIAEKSAHVTMLQRSPTYFFPAPNRNELADTLRELDIPDAWTHEIVRKKILLEQQQLTERCVTDPESVRVELLTAAREYLGDDYDIDTHFTPSYRPWRQRLAFVPDGDLFKGIKAGKASVVTDEIDTFTSAGVKLKSGRELRADTIITATGFDLSVLGDIEFVIDGKSLDFADTWTYRGIMYSGIPNMAWVFGYFRASWTLRADLISEFVCRLLSFMDANKSTVVTPCLRPQDQDMPALPFVDADNFNPGYLARSMHLLPKQGDHAPWVFKQDFYAEQTDIPAADLQDGSLLYE
jgi:cation diffusion facilitator CzcD-associated flavoprotein CzcO